MFNGVMSLATLAIGLAVAAGCADGGPTATAPLGPGGPEAAQSPGQLTAGQIPTTFSRTGEYPGVICGIATTVAFHEAGTEWEASFGPPARETGTLVRTWTNPLNGQWVEQRTSGQVTREFLEFFSDGSFKVREVFRHVVTLSSESGAPLTIAAGHLALEFVVVLLPEGGFTLTEVEVAFVAGPNPDDALTGSPGFCEFVEAALL